MSKEKSFSKVISFYGKYRRMPSQTEIARLFGFKSRNAAYKLVNRMVDKGIVKKDKLGKLSPTKFFGEIKVLGTVEAGFPSPAEEELQDTMTLDEWLVKNKEATYMLKVSGDSMIDAGIMEGDTVLVDRSITPRSGHIVIAEVDGGWTMKYLKKSGNKVELVPANKKFKTIIPKQDLKIAAVVISVIRKYNA